MIRGIAAAASAGPAAEIAREILAAGHGAVDAVIAGFFAAAAEEPSVIFAPCAALVAGVGAGARAFDGRLAQPGKGAPRPRGFVQDDAIPKAARVGVPRSIAMIALYHANRGRAPLRELARAGASIADRAGFKDRGRWIREVGQAGVLALRSDAAKSAIVGAAGALAGGIVSAADLDDTMPADMDATVHEQGAVRVIVPPFAGRSIEGRDVGVIVACDGRGILAALAYVIDREGVPVPELGAMLCRGAEPVRRGVTRVSPGTVIDAPAPIAVVTAEGLSSAVGLAGQGRLDPNGLYALGSGASVDAVLASVVAASGASVGAMVSTDGKEARSTLTRSPGDTSPGAMTLT